MKYFSYYAERLKFSYMSKLVLSSFFSAVMLAFILLTGNQIQLYGNGLFFVAVFFALLYFAGMAIFFYGKNTEKVETIFLFAALLAAVLYIRCCFMYFVSGDYKGFLKIWIEQLSQYKGLDGLKANIGDYTMPYRYFLLFLSKIGGDKLIQIKMFSLCFDLLGAYYVMKMVEMVNKSVTVRIFAFILPLLAPTSFWNSAMWGQCDMIYFAFCLGGIYYAVNNKGRAAVIMSTIAFCFKLQAIFFAPIFIILFFIGKIRWRDLLWSPIVILSSVLPAVLVGANLFETLSPYVTQVQEYRRLTLNIPTIWVLVGGEKPLPFENFNQAGIMLAGAAAVSLVYLGYKYRHKLDIHRVVTITFIGTLLIPFLLPRMHDRYFFAADMMSILYFFYNKKKWYVPLLVIFSSFQPYAYFLYRGENFVPYRYVALMLIGLLGMLLYELVNDLMNGPAPKNPLCSKEDCRMAKKILVREAALSGHSVIEVHCDEKVVLSTDVNLAEVEFDNTDAEADAEADAEVDAEVDAAETDTDAAEIQSDSDAAQNG